MSRRSLPPDLIRGWPRFADKPAVTVLIDPRAKELRADVTRLVRRGGRHGWLLKVLRPMKE